MNVRNLLIVNMIFVAIVALVSILVPERLMVLNGVDVTQSTINLTRAVGAVIVGYAVASWLMRNAAASAARRAFLIGGGVGYLVTAVVFFVNSLSDAGSGMVYVYIVLDILLGAAFLYFGFKKPAEE